MQAPSTLALCNKILTVHLSQYRRSQRYLCTTPIMVLTSQCLYIQSGIIIYLVTFLLFTPETCIFPLNILVSGLD